MVKTKRLEGKLALKVFVGYNLIQLKKWYGVRISRIFQDIDPDIWSIDDFFRKDFTMDKLFEINDSLGQFINDEDERKRFLDRSTRDWWLQEDLFEFKKDVIKYMCNCLGIEPMDVLRNATKKNINQILEKIYKKFVYHQAYNR